MTFSLPLAVLAFLMALATATYSQDTGRYGCLPTAEVTPEITPRELASATRACVEKDDLRTAVQLYLTYSSFILFDQQRVRDETAQVVVGELNNWIFTGYDYHRMQRLRVWINRLRDPQSEFLRQTCEAIQSVGYPTYRPDYMIVRGLMPRKSDDDWITEGFDAEVAWDRALHDINPCPRN